MTKSNMPAAIQERLKQELAKANAKTASSDSNKIALDVHDFVLPNGTVAQTIEGVVVDFVSVNAFWPAAYKEGVIVPPACYAVGDEPRNLVPLPESPDVQAESCAGCQHNVFGSSPTGAGKACKNMRALAFMPLETLDLEEGQAPDIFKLNVPPASIKSFDTFVKSLANDEEAAIMSVVTEITTDPSKKYASLKFKLARHLDVEELPAFMSHYDKAHEMLVQPPNFDIE